MGKKKKIQSAGKCSYSNVFFQSIFKNIFFKKNIKVIFQHYKNAFKKYF